MWKGTGERRVNRNIRSGGQERTLRGGEKERQFNDERKALV